MHLRGKVRSGGGGEGEVVEGERTPQEGGRRLRIIQEARGCLKAPSGAATLVWSMCVLLLGGWPAELGISMVIPTDGSVR